MYRFLKLWHKVLLKTYCNSASLEFWILNFEHSMNFRESNTNKLLSAILTNPSYKSVLTHNFLFSAATLGVIELKKRDTTAKYMSHINSHDDFARDLFELFFFSHSVQYPKCKYCKNRVLKVEITSKKYHSRTVPPNTRALTASLVSKTTPGVRPGVFVQSDPCKRGFASIPFCSSPLEIVSAGLRVPRRVTTTLSNTAKTAVEHRTPVDQRKLPSRLTSVSRLVQGRG